MNYVKPRNLCDYQLDATETCSALMRSVRNDPVARSLGQLTGASWSVFDLAYLDFSLTEIVRLAAEGPTNGD